VRLGVKQKEDEVVKRKRFMSLALTMLLMLTLSADMTAQASEVQAGVGTIDIGTSSPNPTVIGFGGDEWFVIGYDGQGVASETNTMTLLAKESFGTTKFKALSPYTNNYSNSDLQKEMNVAANNVVIITKERGLIIPRALAGGSGYLGQDNYDPDKIAGPSIENALFWPLSTTEAGAVNFNIRDFSNYWWLRSPGYDMQVAAVHPLGYVHQGGGNLLNEYIIRPAVTLNLESVIFTSATVGGKSIAVGSHLSEVMPPTGAMKFTVQDSGQTLDIIGTTAQSAQPSFNFSYTKATTGDNQFVSCVLVGDGGIVKYYGKLKALSMPYDAIGTFSVPFSDVEEGAYTLKLFNEEINGDNHTDFCSVPIAMMLTVDSNGLGTVSDYGDIPPSVTGVMPRGTGVVASTDTLSVTFNEPMDTTVTGTVTVSGAIVSGTPLWSNGNQTVTFGVSGLDYGTAYIVTISGYMNLTGKVIATYEHPFTTSPQPGADGKDGIDGREIELRVGATHIQWRYVGEDDRAWRDSVAIASITGPQGPKGDIKATNVIGATGAIGNGVASIVKTDTNNNVDTYTIFFTNDTKTTFTVTNGKDGVGISDGEIDENGHLVLKLTDGTELNIGQTAFIQNKSEATLPLSLAILGVGLLHLGWIIPLLRKKKTL
jgi:hypothetical protein